MRIEGSMMNSPAYKDKSVLHKSETMHRIYQLGADQL